MPRGSISKGVRRVREGTGFMCGACPPLLRFRSKREVDGARVDQLNKTLCRFRVVSSSLR